MANLDTDLTLGVDAGTECIKAVVVGPDDGVLGRAVVPTRGYFQACAFEAMTAALDDAQRSEAMPASVCATGFAADRVPQATMTATESACHALGAFHRLGHAMTLVNIGGRDPQVIVVDDAGRPVDARGTRRCAMGIGTFLMFTARHLDIHPTRLQELADAAGEAAPVGSYCSVFSETEILERLREGATREAIALGCMRSIAERILEVGGFRDPVVVSGGVAEYFPGVLRALESLTGMTIKAVPDPLFTGALGAAVKAGRIRRLAAAGATAGARQ